MSGIRVELFAFFAAVITGCIVRLCYQCITSLRSIYRHRMIVIELEDLLFWIGTAVYVFVQIYHTSSGVVRWHFILGVVLGTLVATVFLRKMKKMLKKIYDFHLGKNIAKKHKKRYYY